MLRRNGEISRFASPGMELMRSMFSNVAAGSIKDIGRGGPMVEYERRIASGDLVDGDSFQVLFWCLTKSSCLGYFPINAVVKSFPTFLLVHTG